MKKILLVVLTLLLSFLLACCGPQETTIGQEPEQGQTESETEKQPDAEKQPAEEPETFEPVIEINTAALEPIIKFVSAFNTYPEEFTDPGTLSDYALFFAAASHMNGSFEPTADGISYSLPILDLEAAVRELFGTGVSLSDGWTQQNYDPYWVDTENGLIFRSSMGMVSPLLYPYRCVRTDDGLELTMLLLTDPLFAEKYPEIADGGDPASVTPDMVEDIAADMTAYVYTLRDNGNGGYTLAGFRFRNPKPVQDGQY